jgi:phosphoribosylaminoimidazolecarboxamide formyltransferase/IMP cyclohydrolase
MKITRALISVSDKTGVADFARELDKQGVDIISTGGTSELLRKEGVPVRDISSFTDYPEVLEGRVKTLHPRVHGGLLYKRGNALHEQQAKEHGFQPIDLVVVNLYPFESTIAKPDVTLAEAIEQIDIGGPSMIRSAAKNYESVTVVTDPTDYASVLETMRDNEGATTLRLRERLAIKAFIKTSEYDRTISTFLNKEQTTDASFSLSLPLVTRLRYGENPHQTAALYGDFDECFEKLHGKELSFNNILDISAATNLMAEFTEPTVAILKHTNPCGIGSDPDLREAWEKAFATDKQAPFGGIIICNRPIDESLAKAISEIFSEVIIAPDFEADARALFQKKKNLRLIRSLPPERRRPSRRAISAPSAVACWCRTRIGPARRPRHESRDQAATNADGTRGHDLRLARGEACEVERDRRTPAADRTLGIGAGQMSRGRFFSASRVWKAEAGGLVARWQRGRE